MAMQKAGNMPAAELCRQFELSDEGRPLLRPGLSAREFLESLMSHHAHLDAVRLLAAMLPKRAATWWAWTCVSEALGASPPPPVSAALAAVRQWIDQPTDEHRRSAKDAGEVVISTAAGCVAMAAFFSGESLAPAGAPVVAPADHFTAQAAAGAIMLAAVASNPAQAPGTLQAYLQRGMAALDQLEPWREALQPAERSHR